MGHFLLYYNHCVQLFYFSFSLQFDAPEDSPNIRQYCIRIPEGCEPSIHHCHFTNTSFCGSCVYVHGTGARPLVSQCTISNANNVGIFVDDHAQVCVHVYALNLLLIFAVVMCALVIIHGRMYHSVGSI